MFLDKTGKSISARIEDNDTLYTLLVDVKPGSALDERLTAIELKLDAVLKALALTNGERQTP